MKLLLIKKRLIKKTLKPRYMYVSNPKTAPPNRFKYTYIYLYYNNKRTPETKFVYV